MNRDNAKDYLPLVQALAEGKVIQEAHIRFGEPGTEWRDIAGDITFSGSAYCYRIKPEPREIWRNRYSDGSECAIYESKEKALRGSAGEGCVQVCYREVLE